MAKAETIEPTPRRIEICESWGWEYIGEHLFVRDDEIGYFTDNGFKRE